MGCSFFSIVAMLMACAWLRALSISFPLSLMLSHCGKFLFLVIVIML